MAEDRSRLASREAMEAERGRQAAWLLDELNRQRGMNVAPIPVVPVPDSSGPAPSGSYIRNSLDGLARTSRDIGAMAYSALPRIDATARAARSDWRPDHAPR